MKFKSRSFLRVAVLGLLVIALPAIANDQAAVKQRVSTQTSPSVTQAEGIWSGSNQFGSAQTWTLHQGTSVESTHFVFTALSGETVEATTSGRSIQIVYPSGAMNTQVLPDGSIVETVSVRPGECMANPSDVAAVTGGVATARFNAQGQPLDQTQMASFSAIAKALSCETSALRSDLRSFWHESGLPGEPPLNGQPSVTLGAITGGQVHTDVSDACKEATEAAAIALAVWAITGPEDIVAAAAAAIAVLHQHQVCEDNP